MNRQIILASGSPRRIQLLRDAGLEPIIRSPRVDEPLPLYSSPKDTVMFLSLKKALAVEEDSSDLPGSLLIAADTVVALGNEIIGKPADYSQAMDILMSLSGKTHSVLTGVTILLVGEHRIYSFYDKTLVSFKPYTPEDLEDYLRTDEPYDKAGAYAIQGYFGQYVESFRGSYDNVMGLPTQRVLDYINNL